MLRKYNNNNNACQPRLGVCGASIPKLYLVLLLHVESHVYFSGATTCVLRLHCNAEELYSKRANASLLLI